MNSRLLLSILLVSELLVNGYLFVADGTALCGCEGFNRDLELFSSCVGDAVSRGGCLHPGYLVTTKLQPGYESCVPPGGDTLLISNPMTEMLVVNGLDIKYNAACQIESVQIGNVPDDHSVSDGFACADFAEIEEVNFTQKVTGDDWRLSAVSIGPVSSTEGNAFRVTGSGCRFNGNRETIMYQAYGKPASSYFDPRVHPSHKKSGAKRGLQLVVGSTALLGLMIIASGA